MTQIVFFLGLVAVNFLSSLMAQPARDYMDDIQKRFENQIVIVTGASRGIGKGIADLFAQEGAKVVLVSRDEAALKANIAEIQGKKGEAIYIQADISNPEDVKKMIQQVMSRYGRIDVLCHNAGIYPHSRLENMTLQEWDTVIGVNLTGTFLVVQACIPIMRDQGGGKIVVTSSISGPQTGLPGYSHYTASKGGIAGFIRTAAIELAKYKININAVEPGNIMTEGLAELGSEHINNMIRAIPLGRLGTPQDIAYAMLFLASREADFITGQSLIIDGGQTLPESHFSDY